MKKNAANKTQKLFFGEQIIKKNIRKLKIKNTDLFMDFYCIVLSVNNSVVYFECI